MLPLRLQIVLPQCITSSWLHGPGAVSPMQEHCSLSHTSLLFCLQGIAGTILTETIIGHAVL